MAKPWRHPDTKVFYLYRQVPEALRPVIGRRFWKASLHTRDPIEAARLFTAANAELEQRFAAARAELAAQSVRDEITPERARSLVEAYLETSATTKSARWPSLADTWFLEEAADRVLGNVPSGGLPGVDEIGRVVPESLVDGRLTGEAWLRIVAERPMAAWLPACGSLLAGLVASSALPLTRTSVNEVQLMKAWNARVAADVACVRSEAATGRPRSASRLRPDLRMRELLAAWARAHTPRPQTLHEASQSVDDLIDLFGDVPVRTITSDMIYDYRDEARKLPKSMPRADRELGCESACNVDPVLEWALGGGQVSGCGFDHGAGVLLLEPHWAEIAERGV